MAPKLPPGVRVLLEAARYAWDDERGEWSHRTSGRRLKAEVACRMTREQLVEWIGASEGRRRQS